VVATIIHDRRIIMADTDPNNLTDRYVAVWSESGGDVAGVGLEIPLLGAGGRIIGDYRFIEG
jgi:hypothetical protein